MCRRANSIHDCLVCKALKYPTCNHAIETCRNYTNHPFDVTFYKNAEITWFNKCGYCKWARANPTADPSDNVGWPGCCRPPTAPEYAMIKEPTDWEFIARMHNIAVPPEVRRTWKEVGLTTPRATPASFPPVDAKPRTPPLAPVPAIPPQKRVPVPVISAQEYARNKSAALNELMASMSLTSGSLSSSDDDRLETCTVTSEGFTDYLSDSSEEELNRQAVERVQRLREEEEFRAARAILANVDVTPPLEWTAKPRQMQSQAPQAYRPGAGSGISSASLSAYPRSMGVTTPGKQQVPTSNTASVAQIARAMAAQPRAKMGIPAQPVPVQGRR